MTALIIGKVLLWLICIGVFYIGMCWLDYWLGNDRDPENWRLVGLVCPKCYHLFEIAEAVIDMDDVPF